ncbi:cytochrome P450 [Mycena galopus ATCC 62051]|nr:cytochrome P450 [Mycena galopus ATCC 62051]
MLDFPKSTVALGGVALLCFYYLVRPRNRTAPYPPGPPGLPFVGNAFDLPAKTPWKAYREWGQKYNSDVVSVEVFGKRFVVINTIEAAEDLFETRGAIYSSRPSFSMAELAGHTNWDLGWLPYGKRWRDHRQVFHQEFEKDPTAHRAHELAATRRLLKNLFEQPEKSRKYLRHAAGDMIISATYGIQIKEGDPLVDLAEQVVVGIGRSVEPFMVNFFPVLKGIPASLPGAGFQRLAAKWRQMSEDLIRGPFEYVREKMGSQSQITEGTAVPCVTSRALEALEENDFKAEPGVYPEDIQILANVLAMVFIGAADTLVPALNAFVLYMVLNPEVQKKGHAALDAHTSRKYLPDFSDYHSLPYVDALVCEVFRLSAVVPLGVPHFTSTDDVYKGMFIPKDTIVMGNTWALLQDAATYGADTHLFRPERFLGPDGKRNEVPYPEAYFGYGRRICPGRGMALEAIWMIVASILAVFEISPALDENGDPIPVKGKFTSAHPVPFRCTIKPRFEGAVDLIKGGLESL